MRFIVISIAAFLIIFQSCKKSGPVIYTVDAGMKAAFDYKSGSYWIYRDSVTGTTDSAYIAASQDVDYPAGGCVLMRNEPEIENISITVIVSDGNSLDTERWYFSMQETKFNLGLYNNKDKVESNIGFNLFTWPLATGPAVNGGCVLSPDSGAVTDMIPEVSLNGQSYTNAARSAHKPLSGRDTSMVYNDCFYVNQNAGIIKLVFDHPNINVHRVLELQRYHIVK